MGSLRNEYISIIQNVSIGFYIDLVMLLVLLNVGVILALILVLIKSRKLRKSRESFEHLFWEQEKILEKEQNVFWKELERLNKA